MAAEAPPATLAEAAARLRRIRERLRSAVTVNRQDVGGWLQELDDILVVMERG